MDGWMNEGLKEESNETTKAMKDEEQRPIYFAVSDTKLIGWLVGCSVDGSPCISIRGRISHRDQWCFDRQPTLCIIVHDCLR